MVSGDHFGLEFGDGREYPPPFNWSVRMAKMCDICGKGVRSGRTIVRHGLPKKKGGIGLHTTGVTKPGRTFCAPSRPVARTAHGSVIVPS